MIKSSIVVFLCLLLPFSLEAKARITQDTIQISGMQNPDTVSHVEEIPTVTLEDAETNDEGGSDQGVSSVLSAGRDPFLSAASFNFSIARFRIRGYDNDYYETYMNGIPTEYIDNGFSSYNLWLSSS